MDNLKLITQVVLQKSDLITEARCLTVDPLVGIIWVATDTAVYSIHAEHNEIEPIGCLHKADSDKYLVHYDGIAADAKIVMLDSVSSIESICIAVNTGEVLLLHSSPYELECVGCCDGGVSCMAWSPDQEVVLFVTNDHKLILMTKDFDIISEQSANQAGFGEAEPINVGWGKKETQFHGSLGKAAAQSKQESSATSTLSSNDNSYVSWRGDGQYFICSTINPDTGKRLMRVWSRDLTLHSTVESLDGLEYPLCWRPSGNLIASVQRKPHKHDIIFFERNGLQHGSFTLPFGKDEMVVRQLLWNASSSVLGVWLEPLQFDCKGNHCVQLWTMSNYHWYLKMELNFTNAAKEVAAVSWDPVSQLKLHIVTRDGQYASYDFLWEVSQSEGSSHSNQASIVLIDGGRLLYTAFRKCIIPPPMCSHVLTSPETMAVINQVTFSPCLRYMLVLSSMGHIMLYCLSQDDSLNKDQHGFQSVTPCPKLLNSTRFPLDDASVVLPRHLTWYQEKQLLGVKWDINSQVDYLYQYSITYDDDHLTIDKIAALPCEEEVIAVHSNSTKVAVQLNNGSVIEYSAEGGLMPWILKDGSSLQLTEPCPHMRLATFNGQNVVVGLSQTAKLYVNTTQLAANCSSFYIHDNFLLLTTHWHTVHCISLHQDVSELRLLTNENTGHENIRKVERGSRIVTAVSCDTRVVLQMPRGNLETISPRALVLSHLRKLLDNKEFGETFVMMRKHRINMNLLYDHNPQLFLDNVAQFVQQLLTVGGLDLFLSELSDQDVTITMYTGDHGQHQHNKDITQSYGGCEGKVDLVCDTILKCLDDLGGGSAYLLATITALVKKTTPELESVLVKIKQLQASGTVINGITVDDALKHSLFLVDVNQLYDVALGMYDFDLVLMVAEKSQKDPKEYLPFLNRLRKMDDHYRKYSIDCHLQRYPKALQHLSQCNGDRFEEALSLIKTHHLYTLGLDLYSSQPEQYMTIAHAFGTYLVAKKRFKEAVLMFRRAQDLPAALEACEGWGCWQQAFVLSAELHQSKEERMALARRMADRMKQRRQYKEAAHVLSQYASDPEEAIVVLLEGGAWADSLCMAHQTGRADLVQTNIEPAILEAHQAQVSTVEGLDANFTQFSTRLSVVRKSKDASTRILADGRVMEEKEDDLFSETSSIASLHSAMASSTVHSRSTAHSKKNRRKAEKKKYNLKEGSVYEDIALMTALADIVTNVDNMQNDIGELLTALVQFNHDTLARQLQQLFTKLLNTVKEQMNTIWPPTTPHNAVTSLTGPQSTTNSIVTGHLAADMGRNDVPPAPSMKSVHWQLDFL